MQSLGSTRLDLREIITVSYLMYILKEHYSLMDNPRNSDIRQYILLIVKQFTTRVVYLHNNYSCTYTVVYNRVKNVHVSVETS